jgi:hypothetical protein
MVFDPFGGLAIHEGPMALRPTLADGLPLSRTKLVASLKESYGVFL